MPDPGGRSCAWPSTPFPRPECGGDREERGKIREEVGVGVEVLVHAPTCYPYPGRCTMRSYTRQEWRFDGEGKNHFLGSPNRGGLCYRICLTEWDRIGGDGAVVAGPGAAATRP